MRRCSAAAACELSPGLVEQVQDHEFSAVPRLRQRASAPTRRVTSPDCGHACRCPRKRKIRSVPATKPAITRFLPDLRRPRSAYGWSSDSGLASAFPRKVACPVARSSDGLWPHAAPVSTGSSPSSRDVRHTPEALTTAWLCYRLQPWTTVSVIRLLSQLPIGPCSAITQMLGHFRGQCGRSAPTSLARRVGCLTEKLHPSP
jgi:hypothetical protein